MITIDTFIPRPIHRAHITPCKECTMHSITHPMLRAISTIRGTQPTLLDLIREGHDLHTTVPQSLGRGIITRTTHGDVCPVCTRPYPYHSGACTGRWPAPKHVPMYTTTTYSTEAPTITPTHKEQYPMHYKATLNTHTTMAWLILATIHVVLYTLALTYIPLPTWGGIHTILTVGRLMSMGGALIAALAYRYVRKNGEVVLSTRDLGL